MTIDFDNILNLGVGGKKQTGTIKAIHTEKVPDREGSVLPKIILVVETDTNTFKIDEAWVYNKDNELKPQGLWIKLDSKKQINAISTVAKVLRYLQISTLNNLIGQKIELYPKPNGFLAMIACDNDEFKD